jgi:membrane-bound lytic murein transglycosylase D
MSGAMRLRSAFWLYLFTGVDKGEALIHDRRNPALVYEHVKAEKPGKHVTDHQLVERIRRLQLLLKELQQPPESTWTADHFRLRALFRHTNNEELIEGAHRHLRTQRGLASRFRESLIRSTALADTVEKILSSYNVPRALAALPHLESAYDPWARSRVGAAGMWQFMPATAVRYMRVDSLVDERWDPLLATHGAAKLLTRNQAHLDAWPLAITAYNHGLSGMKRAVRATGGRSLDDIIDNYDGPAFGFASSNFYAAFLAAAVVHEKPFRWFPDLANDSLYPRPPMRRQTIGVLYEAPVSLVAAFLGISTDRLQEQNPALNPAIFAEDQNIPEGYSLHLPGDFPLSVEAYAMWALPADRRPGRRSGFHIITHKGNPGPAQLFPARFAAADTAENKTGSGWRIRRVSIEVDESYVAPVFPAGEGN